MSRRTITLGRLVLTTVVQSQGAPWVDGCWVVQSDRKWVAGGLAVTRARKGRPTTALVVARKGVSPPNPHRWFRCRKRGARVAVGVHLAGRPFDECGQPNRQER